MTRRASARLGVYAAFASAAFLLALVFGRPELAALGAPFAAFLVLALALARAPELTVAVTLADARAIEGQPVDGELELSAVGTLHEVEVALVLPHGVELVDGEQRLVLRLAAGERRTLPFSVVAWRWGAYRIGAVAVRVHDRFGLIAHDAFVESAVALRAYPRPERLRSLVAPLETQPFAGDRVARVRGDGIEFADLRPFVSGDRVRRINWRASARRGELYVNERHPERNSDVVLFLDTFAEVQGDRTGTHDVAVRAAASLAREYLQRRDRVGVIGFGGAVQWLLPALGTAQAYRIADALLTSQVTLSYALKGVDVLPPRTLPPQALVVALSPLLDERSIGALFDLRARGFDLVVVDVSPLPFVDAPASAAEALALRLWPLWRDSLRFRYERLGVPVVEWTDGTPLAQVIEEVSAFRRFGAQRVRLAVWTGRARPRRRARLLAARRRRTTRLRSIALLAAAALALLGLSLVWTRVLGLVLAVLAAELVVRGLVAHVPAGVAVAYGTGLLLLAELVAWAGALRPPAVVDRAVVGRRAAHLCALTLLGAVAAGLTLAGSRVASPNAFAAGVAGAAAVAGLAALLWSVGRAPS